MGGAPGIRLLVGPPHPCGYLPGQVARMLHVDPRCTPDAALYGALAQLGFRRSGSYVYRPACPSCTACIPCRIPAARFLPNRSQRRCLTKNSDLAQRDVDGFTPEHYSLYRRYVRARHPGGGMDIADPGEFAGLFEGAWTGMRRIEYHLDGRPLAVSVVDELPDGLSAVYTFYDPDEASRSLGVLAVLRLIQEAASRPGGRLYLGYWISECAKMRYKARYRPMEVFAGDAWQML